MLQPTDGVATYVTEVVAVEDKFHLFRRSVAQACPEEEEVSPTKVGTAIVAVLRVELSLQASGQEVEGELKALIQFVASEFPPREV